VQWQLASRPGVLPSYDRALLARELELFPQWYIGPHRKQCIDAPMRKTLDDTFQTIIENNLAWPSVFVHRDFMPRNLMVQPGAADFVVEHRTSIGPHTQRVSLSPLLAQNPATRLVEWALVGAV
jgi:aminoglycoside/choline kinase family phosphotransferase